VRPLALLLLLAVSARADEISQALADARSRADQERAAAPAAKPARAGERWWVFVVSVLEWKDSKAFVSFPKENRRDALLVKHFIEAKGVPTERIVWLKDNEATQKAIRSALAAQLARTRKGDSIFLYYAGHGSREEPGVTYFVPHDARGGKVAATSWAVPEIIDELEKGFQGESAIVAADCCHSGGLCAAAKERGRRISYACFASAQSSSYSTGEWTFSDSLLRGLTGSSLADADGDKTVRLGEAADYIESEMAAVEEQMSASLFTGRWTAASPIAAVSYTEAPPARTARLAEPKPDFPAGAALFAEWEGTWYKAKVLGTRHGIVHVHYEGYTDYWDEWVAPGRVAAAAPCGPAPCKPK
jgi:hypothetical protein